MRILLLAGSYPPETGGIAQFMRAFAEGLTARGVDVDIIANPALPARGYLKRIEACRNEVLRRIQSQPPGTFDRIVASSWSPYAVTLPAPFDVFCHGMDLLEPSHSLRYRVLMKRTLQRASRVLANSQYTAELCIRFGARSESVVVLHPGVDCRHFQPSNGLGATKVILSMGRLVQRKGFDVVLHAMPQVLAAFPDAHYICAGDGPDRKRLQELAATLKISLNVSWPGEVTEEEKLSLYHSAVVFAMPNRLADEDGSVEGFGIVFLEAAACAVPAIGGNSGGVPDAIIPDVTGYLVEPTSVEDVATRIIGLFSNPELRRKMGMAARQRALTDFREDQIAERYLRQTSLDSRLSQQPYSAYSSAGE